MKTGREQFVNEVNSVLVAIATKVFNNQGINYEEPDDYLSNFFGVDSSELELITGYVSDYFPDNIYLDQNKYINTYVQSQLAKELTTFLVQEDKFSSEFRSNLENLRNDMLSKVLNDIYVATKIKA